MYIRILCAFTLLLACTACSLRPSSIAYQQQYDYLKTDLTCCPKMQESEYYIVFLVNARRLDYTENRSLLKTIAKHPSDGSKNGDVGHAWIYLKGNINGCPMYVEGGHSGERGIYQAKYFEGVMNGIDYGYANPTPEQKRNCRFEPNPVKYLWATQQDGFYQEGNGGHSPTFAAKVDLTREQFEKVLAFVQPENYEYRNYQLTGNQCSSFLGQIANIIDFPMKTEVTIQIGSKVSVGCMTYQMWDDPRYEMLTFSSPDIIERCLIEAVRDGRAENATSWYRKTHH